MYVYLCVGVCWGESKRKRETYSQYLLCGEFCIPVCMYVCMYVCVFVIVCIFIYTAL